MELKDLKDCPICGSKNSMEYKRNMSETFKSSILPPFTVKHLDGYICKKCNDGFYTKESIKKIEAKMKQVRDGNSVGRVADS